MTDSKTLRLFDPTGTPQMARAAFGLASLRQEDPGGYIAGLDLLDAINAGILLGQPLLLTGEPGVGKTSVGRMVASKLDLPLLEFTVKSTSRASDLFYEYDAVGRFQAAEAERAAAARMTALAAADPSSLTADLRDAIAQEARRDPRTDLLRFVKVRALGRAILNASEAAAVSLLLDSRTRHAPAGLRYVRDETGGEWREMTWASAPQQSVVIIDEIDKAPSDFCNDLLDELDYMRFQVPELAVHTPGGDAPRFGGHLPAHLRPIVFITSNQERPLPDAFLRRCCFHHIAMPQGDALQRILESRLSEGAQLDPAVLEGALNLFRALRDRPGLVKPPGLAELLNWLRYLSAHVAGEGFDKALKKRSLTALIKDPVDLDKVRAFIDEPPL